jgi:tRNA threonylcarbamoyladenosine biosynthesis protein TsaE
MASTISHSAAETFAFGRTLAATLKGGEIIALCGDLGAGKTHLCKGIAAGLGCPPDEVTSPTFTLVHEYRGGRLPVFHFDFYRLESEAEALAIGLDDYLAAGGVVLIEWADKFRPLLPAATRWIELREVSPDVREISTIGEQAAAF